MSWRHAFSAIEISFLEEVARALQKITTDHDESLAKRKAEFKEMPEDEYKYIEEVYGGDILIDQAFENDRIQQILALSFIMSICMTIENQLGELCDHLQRKHEEKIPLRDFRGHGRGIQSRVDYVEAVSQKKFLDENRDFRLLIEMRNIIAHENGAISTDQRNKLRSKYADSVILPAFADNKIHIKMSSLHTYVAVAETITSEISDFWTEEIDPLMLLIPTTNTPAKPNTAHTV